MTTPFADSIRIFTTLLRAAFPGLAYHAFLSPSPAKVPVITSLTHCQMFLALLRLLLL